MEVLNGSFRMPKEQFNAYLRELIDDLKKTGQGIKPKPA